MRGGEAQNRWENEREGADTPAEHSRKRAAGSRQGSRERDEWTDKIRRSMGTAPK